VRVALFIPCFVDQLSPSVAEATESLLRRLGCQVEYEPDQTCCGQPFVTSGVLSGARPLARRHLELFAGADAVVCPSASCTATVRRRYSDLIELDAEARRVCERTFELGEFIVRQLGLTDVGARFPHRVALLQSCHGLRDLGLGTPSESLAPSQAGSTELLLRDVADLELCVPPRDECCGFGGLFSVDFPEVSSRIGRSRLRELADLDAAFVTGTDTTCLMHLDGLRARGAAGPRSIHLAEILVAQA
jgi:L-lactate dehydrogenase complex protein LldE